MHPPFPIFDLVHLQFICFFGTDEQLFYLNSFYPVTGLPMKRTVVTRTACYLVTFDTTDS